MDKRIIAALMSILIPGLGQFYGGRKIRGIVVFLGVFSIAYIMTILPIMQSYPIFPICFILASFDAYRVSPKADVYIRLGLKMGIIGMVFLFLAIGAIKNANEWTPFPAIFLLVMALIFMSMMHSDQRSTTATLRVHDAIAKMGYSPAETWEITNEVVSILKAGGGSYHSNSDGPLTRMSDAIVSAGSGWADFTPIDLSSVISIVLENRERRQRPPIT